MRRHRLDLLALAALASWGCSAILTPRDGVQRCGNASECDLGDDNRYTVECLLEVEEQGSPIGDEPGGVCVAAFRPDVSCDDEALRDRDPRHPLPVAMEALGTPGRYASCEETPGVIGCPAAGDGCADGLVERGDGTCDVSSDPEVPAVNVHAAEAYGQDVRDQFCRSFFCDERFVCDRTAHTCVLCRPGAPFGEGGCGEVYIAGQRSCAYLEADTLEDVCDGPDAEEDIAHFGAC